MSELEIQGGSAAGPDEAHAPQRPTPPIESRFLFVDVAAMRAKQLRRGAKPRLPQDGHRPTKPERVAMEEVKQGYVEWQLPDFKAVFDTR
jgi:DNA-directed RNA polymerase omega subunit